MLDKAEVEAEQGPFYFQVWPIFCVTGLALHSSGTLPLFWNTTICWRRELIFSHINANIQAAIFNNLIKSEQEEKLDTYNLKNN